MIESVLEKKAEEITVLDLRSLTPFTDYFVICSGTSEPQIKSIYKNVEEKLAQHKLRCHHVEGKAATGWILMDFDDFIVHIFSPEKRSYYEIENLWADAPRWSPADSDRALAAAARK